MTDFKAVKMFLLRTQEIREGLAAQLQKWIRRVESEVEAAEDPNVRAEWTRLLGFLSQTLNSIMKAYDQIRLDEDIKRVEEMLGELKRVKERLDKREQELKEWERRLRAREEELSRKLKALENR